jgi:anthranilate synthase/indole-3-glycerol phosphate synthase/phosphoribosylanthranilate isomerase
MSASADILDKIGRQRALDVKAAQSSRSIDELAVKAAADFPKRPLDLHAAVRDDNCVIAAEFKRASPSKGWMVDAATPVEDKVGEYCAGGARILSVLTEPTWFKGSLEDMQCARRRAEAWAAERGCARPIILRKDFIIDEYQVAEARAYGADTLLLIVSLLPTVEALKPLIDASRAHGLEPLVEVNSTAELEVAAAAGSRVIGVNNRNLRTFVVDLGATARVVAAAAVLARRAGSEHAGDAAPGAPLSVLSLSGLRSGDDIAPLFQDCIDATAAGFAAEKSAMTTGSDDPTHAAHTTRAAVLSVLRGFLIGEALMRAPDAQATVAAFVSAASDLGGSAESSATLATGGDRAPPLVKICGVRAAGDAVHAARCGADLIGLILVPGSARFADPAGAGAEAVAAVRAFREQDPRSLLAQLQPQVLSSAAPAAAAARSVATALQQLSQRAAQLRRAIQRARPLTVGVCMDQRTDAVLASAAACGVDLVQLHGSEDPAEVAAAYAGAAAAAAAGSDATAAVAAAAAARPPLPPFIKVLHVQVEQAGTDGGAAARVDAAARIDAAARVDAAAVEALGQHVLVWARAGAAAILLDTAVKGAGAAGGTGQAFNHSAVLAALAASLSAGASAEGVGEAALLSLPVLLAGGLAAENVATAAHSAAEEASAAAGGSAAVRVRVHAMGVDVSSGVEVAGGPKGSKDAGLVAAFVRAAKGAVPPA